MPYPLTATMVVALNSPQPVFPLPPLDSIPDAEEDSPKSGAAIVSFRPTFDTPANLILVCCSL